MFDHISVSDAAARVRRRQLEPLELVERCLEQIRKYEDRVHAWVLVDEQGARRAAREMGQEAARGDCRGPLHGVPLGIKDIVDVEGLPTRAGSPLRADHVAEADAPLVAALRRAGAIVLGKTVTVEFACFDPSPSRNPWNPDLKHTPGGSSSGSAVAVALGMCPGAIGTQTGGSLVRPASYCGIATCKPTFGRVDRDGIVPVSFHFDHPGPMARRVADLEIILQYLPRSHDFAPPPAERIVEPSLPPRLGLIEEFFIEESDNAIRQATEAALARLDNGGAEIVPVAPCENFAEVAPMHRRIMAVETAEYHRQQFAAHRDSYGPMITGLLEEGLSTSAVDYAAALAHRRQFRRQAPKLLENVDALIVPSTHTTAPATLETTGTSKFQAPWSYTGLPVVSIPCGVASDGMPAAVQLVGRYHHESPLFRIAEWCERCFAFDNVPPLLSDAALTQSRGRFHSR